MKKILHSFSIFVFCLIASHQIAHSQTILQHDIDWSTHHQNMWGPNGNPFTIDLNINLFSFEYDTSMSFGSITNILGGQFGTVVDIDTWFKFGSDFVISGFTTGYVDVDYPVSIFLEIPDDNSFCPGDEVTIQSSYEVRPGWKLDTHFPTAGIIKLTMDFGFDLDVDATVCVFTCTTIPIIDVHVPYDTISIVELNSQTGVFTYPCYNPNNFPPIGICNDTILPITFSNLFGLGLSGSVTLPYVETTSYIDTTTDPCHKNLYADGDSTWIELEVDVVQFLSAMAGLIPPPQGPAIQQFLQNLSGTIDLGMGFSIYYNLFSAWFDIKSTMKQNFIFEPFVWNHFQFPTTVDFFVTNPNTNLIVDSGNASIIEFLACHNLTYTWPCADIQSMDVGVTHSLGNNFTNHTWDSLSFSFTIQALHFIIDLPIFLYSSIDSIPEICIPVDTTQTPTIHDLILCMDEIMLHNDTLAYPEVQIVIGPLIDETWPLGYIPITWFNQTWELAGFHDTIFPPFSMATNCPQLQVESQQTNNILCYGQSTGSATISVSNGKPDYTYEWSHGFSETTAATSSTAQNISAGIYYVTITDANGCSVVDSIEVLNSYPPITVQTQVVDVTCVGGSDGSITLQLGGGLPPYQYVWSPPVGNSHAVGGLAQGTYNVTITDSNNCDTVLSISIIELYDLPPVDFYAEPISGCQPLQVEFYETSPDEGQSYLWHFGTQNGFASGKNPIYTYNSYGLFDVLLTVTSVHGCENSLLFEDYIEVYAKPTAGFTTMPQVTDILDPSVHFFNQSSNTHICNWTFGDGYSSNVVHPYHVYADTGSYQVTLIVETEHGCKDTAYSSVRINDISTLYIPNAFSPDKDGNNEIFIPAGHNVIEEKYSMKIFDRWGKLIFETENFHQGWDGTYNSYPCKSDSYVYFITYEDDKGVTHRVRGAVFLIR
jgi:gliding motility-associated-like protein